MTPRVVALVADLRTIYANGGGDALAIAERINSVGATSLGELAALLGLLVDCAAEFFEDDPQLVSDALSEVVDSVMIAGPRGRGTVRGENNAVAAYRLR